MTKISVTPEIEAALPIRADLGEDIERCAERILREALGRPNDLLPAPPPKQKQGNGDMAARRAEPHDDLENELAWYQRVRQVIPEAVDSVRLLID